jgi:hypothetical protein
MGYVTATTKWPSFSVSVETKQLLERLFSLVDNKSNDSGELLAREVFIQDGKFFGTTGNFEGSAGTSSQIRAPDKKKLKTNDLK